MIQFRSCLTNYGVTKSDAKEAIKKQFENAPKRKNEEKTKMTDYYDQY